MEKHYYAFKKKLLSTEDLSARRRMQLAVAAVLAFVILVSLSFFVVRLSKTTTAISHRYGNIAARRNNVPHHRRSSASSSAIDACIDRAEQLLLPKLFSKEEGERQQQKISIVLFPQWPVPTTPDKNHHDDHDDHDIDWHAIANSYQATLKAILPSSSSSKHQQAPEPSPLITDIVLVFRDSETYEKLLQLESKNATKLFGQIVKLRKRHQRAVKIRKLTIDRYRTTVFHEMLDVSEKLASSHYVVFVTAGSTNFSPYWLEHLMAPLLALSSSDGRAVISTAFTEPIDDGGLTLYNSNGQPFKLSINVEIAPFWISPTWSLTNRTTYFLPELFAVNRKSEDWRNFLSFLREWNVINDATTIDATNFFWRCTSRHEFIVTSNCSKFIGSSSSKSFDAKIGRTIKRRIVGMWFEDYRSAAAARLDLKSFSEAERDVSMCRPFPWFINKTLNNEDLILRRQIDQFGRLATPDNICFEVSPSSADDDDDDATIYGDVCSKIKQKFVYDNDGFLIDDQSGKCLALSSEAGRLGLTLQTCSHKDDNLKWDFVHYGDIHDNDDDDDDDDDSHHDEHSHNKRRNKKHDHDHDDGEGGFRVFRSVDDSSICLHHENVDSSNRKNYGRSRILTAGDCHRAEAWLMKFKFVN